MTQQIRWTTSDLELLPESSNRYEIIDGELYVTRAPNWRHQTAISNATAELREWSIASRLGIAIPMPGIIFSDADNVIPDLIWISHDRLALTEDEAGHFTAAPELIIEVLSFGKENEKRDRETKLKLYSTRGTQEYWILNWKLQQVEVYRREQAVLQLFATLNASDTLVSPLLPGFSCLVSRFFL
ncbi:MAG: Uma2 family endonuclease [Phormidium tanganyikae FI6-MK23]|jgi:Uma2 family endonuclease|nr:Uma2 family endonuclease [Phormidium tanganyikae FI6-MK23]